MILILNFIAYTDLEGLSTASSYCSLFSFRFHTVIHVVLQIKPANEVVKMMLDHMTNTGNGTHIKLEKGTV